jgi:hypothetical protein
MFTILSNSIILSSEDHVTLASIIDFCSSNFFISTAVMSVINLAGEEYDEGSSGPSAGPSKRRKTSGSSKGSQLPPHWNDEVVIIQPKWEPISKKQKKKIQAKEDRQIYMNFMIDRPPDALQYHRFTVPGDAKVMTDPSFRINGNGHGHAYQKCSKVRSAIGSEGDIT